MTSEKSQDFLNRVAKVISVIFHPLFMPLYGMAIILSAPTLFGYLPFNVKRLLILIMLVNNVLLPFSLMPFFIQRHIVSSYSLDERKDRNIPLILTTVLYCTTSYIIFKFPIPAFLKTYIFATAILSLVVTIINFRWKISIHSVAAGALTAIVLLLSMKMAAPLEWYLIPSIIAAGVILSSRLKLNVHNPAQVWVGFFTGLFGLTLFMALL
jgi:hypothetical protein